MDRRISVFVDLQRETHLVGTLWARHNKGRESATFEYAREWLANPNRFSLEPALELGGGAFQTGGNRRMFGALGDSAPDRWGRVLIQRAERQNARDENRQPRTLNELDYLLGVGDVSRQGALRLRDEDGPFLAPQDTDQIPPLIALPRLLNATEAFAREEETAEDMRLLLAPGSSLGGARPKASVRGGDGQLAIAKFSKPDDDIRVPLWEAVALTLAGQAGINTPSFRLEWILEKPVLILDRFDRIAETRIPYLSAMSMLGAQDNEMHSYMEIADALRQYGANPGEDCAELWRRIVFTVLISNTDDHLRNHGFLHEKNGWNLSPAFDLNPVPLDVRPHVLNTAIDEGDPTASVELALDVADHFGLKSAAAKQIVDEVNLAVSGWRKVAADLGLAAKEIERMASAFRAE